MEKSFKVIGKLVTKDSTCVVSVKKPNKTKTVPSPQQKIRIIPIVPNEVQKPAPRSPIKVSSTRTSPPTSAQKRPRESISWTPTTSSIVSPRKQKAQQIPVQPVVKTENFERKFWCFLCKIPYNQKDLLLTHLNRIHGVTLFKCDFCNEQFADSLYRERHITQAHIRFPTETPEQLPDVHEEEDVKVDEYSEQIEWLDQDNGDDDIFDVKVLEEPEEEDIPEPPTVHKTLNSGIRKEFVPMIERLRMKVPLGKRPSKVIVHEAKKRRLESQEDDSDDEEAWWARPVTIPDPKKHAIKDKSKMCHICGEQKLNLSVHMRKVHTNSRRCPSCSGKIYDEDHTPHKCLTRRPTYFCSCGEEFKIREHMHGHMLEKSSPDHEIQCTNCEATFGDFNMYHDHIEEVHPSPFLCNQCGKQFSKKANLKSHVYSIHVVEKPIIKCHLCGAECRGERNVKRHIMYVHQKATRINCEICQMSIFDKISLRRHMKYKHGQKKEFVCNVCKKEFATADSLRYHLTIHTGARPFPCPFCPKSFKINSELRKHYRAHKELTVKCPSCSLYCLNEDDLRKHIRRYPAHDITHVYVEEAEEVVE